MNLKKNDFIWILPLALLLGGGLASLQVGNWWVGFAFFAFLLLLSFTILQFSYRWASRAERSVLRLQASQGTLSPPLRTETQNGEEHSRHLHLAQVQVSALAWIIAITFATRLLVSVSLYVFL